MKNCNIKKLLKVDIMAIFRRLVNENEDYITDPITYLVELIIQISKNVTKGRGLSRRGVNALFLFLLTGILLYFNTDMPTKFVDILKLYYIPLFFLIYFIYDLTKNIQKIDRFWRRLFQKTEFAYNNIIEGDITHGDLEFYLLTIPFSSEQIETILTRLIENKQLSPKAQTNLFKNNKIYRVDTLPFLKYSLINFHWVPSAVCSFLKNTRENLQQEFLDELIEKYGQNPSVSFAFGQFHSYTKDNSNIYFKMGYEFKYRTVLIKIFKFLMLILLILFSFVGLIFLIIPSDLQITISKYVIILGILIIIAGISLDYVRENHFKWAIKKHLKNYNSSNDSYIYDKLIDDLVEVY